MTSGVRALPRSVQERARRGKGPASMTTQRACDVFSAAERGDVAFLGQCSPTQLTSLRDDHGWTVLMVAAAAGATAAVKHIIDVAPSDLVSSFAAVVDARGHDAFALAQFGGHAEVAHALLQHSTANDAAMAISRRGLLNDDAADGGYSGGPGAGDSGGAGANRGAGNSDEDDDDVASNRTISPAASDDELHDDRGSDSGGNPTTSVSVVDGHDANSIAEDDGDAAALPTSGRRAWCEACQAFFSTSGVLHTQTIPHRLACQPPDLSTPFALTARNKGFQMMMRSGWDARGGLGPDGEGQLVPVKTVLKRDLLGIGIKPSTKAAPTSTAKVTHFVAGDEAAILTAPTTTSAHDTAGDGASGTSTRRGQDMNKKRQRGSARTQDKRLRQLLSDGPARDLREDPDDPVWE